MFFWTTIRADSSLPMSFWDTNESACRSTKPDVIDRRLQVQMSLRKKLMPAWLLRHERCNRYEQRQSFGWLAFISCPADMRTSDTLETRDANAPVVQRCNLMQQQTRGWVWRHWYTPAAVVKRLEKRPGFPSHPVPPYICPGVSLSLSLFLPCFRCFAASLLHPTSANNSWDGKSAS